MSMHGSETMRTFCCECGKVTLHRYKNFGKKCLPEKDKKRNLLVRVLAALFSELPTGDYKCTVCGTNLRTPDNLD